MSLRAMHWAIHEVRGIPNKILLMVLAEYADDQDVCWPSQDRLARECELSVSTVRRTLRAYEHLGLVTSDKRYVITADGSKVRASNIYTLHVGHLPQTTKPVDNPPADLPVNLTGRGTPVDSAPVDNFERPGLFVENTATGHSDRKGTPTDQIQGGYRSQVTGITTPNHQIEPPNQTQPDPDSHQTPASRSGQVRSGQANIDAEPTQPAVVADQGGLASPAAAPPQDAAGESTPAQPTQPASRNASGPLPAGLNQTEIDLIAACLPGWMRALDRTGARQVAALLDQRVKAGWTPDQIRAAVDGNPPANVTRLSGIACHRIEFNLPLELAPNRAAAHVPVPAASQPGPVSPTVARTDLDERRAAQDAADAARRHRSEVLAGTHRPTRHYTGPAWDNALTQARAQHPDAGRLELLAAAQAIYNTTSQPQPQGTTT